ncbi:MAG: cyclic nucleotide-binding domain-containing protein [Xanthomonadales bacterium]|nr:cyclic nucleotide-binding domain-containing protein [Xanthomonadales bacterium]
MSQHEAPLMVVPAGERIFACGQKLDSLLLVAEGKVALLAPGAARPWRRLGPGSAFGEAALAGDGLSPYEAVAETEVRLLPLDRPALAALFKRHPDTGVALLGRLAEAVLQALVSPVAAEPHAAAEEPLPVTEQHAVAAEEPVPAPAPAPRPGDWQLVLPDGQRLELEPLRSEFLIGRPDPASGHCPEIDLSGHDPYRSLSRRHARLLRDGERWLLREEPGVVNGTFCNEVRLAPGEAVEIREGDRLRFGAVQVVLARHRGGGPR